VPALIENLRARIMLLLRNLLLQSVRAKLQNNKGAHNKAVETRLVELGETIIPAAYTVVKKEELGALKLCAEASVR
jgi:hypothetical protein